MEEEQNDVQNIENDVSEGEQTTCEPEDEQTETKEENALPQDKAKISLRKKRIKTVVWNVFLVVIIAVGIFTMFQVTKELGSDADIDFLGTLKNIRPVLFVVFVLVVVGIMFLDSCKFAIINKTVTGRVRLSTAAKCSFLGRYYDAVTPFSSGGQPMQIVYLSGKGISGGNSSAIVLIRYITSILSWIILGGALMIYGQASGVFARIGGGADALKILGWVGIGVNLIIPVFVLMFLILPKFMYKLTYGVVKLGNKMRIVKDVEKTAKRATKVVDDFKNTFKIMATSPINLLCLILVSFAEAFLTFSIPFFVMNAFIPLPADATSVFTLMVGMENLLPIMSLNAFATFGASFIPTPGSTGGIETLGAVAFQLAAGFGVATTISVLFWRLGVYYIYILIGISLTVADIIRKSVRAKRARNMLNAPPLEKEQNDPPDGEPPQAGNT